MTRMTAVSQGSGYWLVADVSDFDRFDLRRWCEVNKIEKPAMLRYRGCADASDGCVCVWKCEIPCGCTCMR